MKHLTIFALVLLISTVLAFAQENTTNVTVPVEVPTIECGASRCDSECVKCSDKLCHDPGFQCKEELTLDRFFPTDIKQGETQLNIVLKNTGTVDLAEISATISGDGIQTLDIIPLKKLAAGDKDYVFAKINASKSGIIDLVIKVFIGDAVKFKYVDQISVAEQPKVVVPTETINVTLLNSDFDKLKQKYKTLEALYQEKKTQGFPVELIYDNLRAAFNRMTDTQNLVLQEDYKKAQASLAILKSNLADVEEQLTGVKKEEATISETVKTNMLFYGSIAAALVSIFTAYTLIKNSIDKKKLLELHKRLTSKKKAKKKKK